MSNVDAIPDGGAPRWLLSEWPSYTWLLVLVVAAKVLELRGMGKALLKLAAETLGKKLVAEGALPLKLAAEALGEKLAAEGALPLKLAAEALGEKLVAKGALPLKLAAEALGEKLAAEGARPPIKVAAAETLAAGLALPLKGAARELAFGMFFTIVGAGTFLITFHGVVTAFFST